MTDMCLISPAGAPPKLICVRSDASGVPLSGDIDRAFAASPVSAGSATTTVTAITASEARADPSAPTAGPIDLMCLAPSQAAAEESLKTLLPMRTRRQQRGSGDWLALGELSESRGCAFRGSTLP